MWYIWSYFWYFRTPVYELTLLPKKSHLFINHNNYKHVIFIGWNTYKFIENNDHRVTIFSVITGIYHISISIGKNKYQIPVSTFEITPSLQLCDIYIVKYVIIIIYASIEIIVMTTMTCDRINFVRA